MFMFTRPFRVCIVVLALAGGVATQGAVLIDDFEQAHDFVADGVAGTVWDGFIGLGNGETVEALNASLDRAGQLYMASANAFWHEPWTPLGPFLYKIVEGDFVATVKVTDYQGTAAAPLYHNNCGLLARALLDDAGPGEDWVAIDYFPIWSCGNFVRTANDNVRTENGHNGKQFNLDPYLQIERVGNTFHFRTSADGVSWTEMGVSPIVRDDLADIPLQVGLYQATYSADSGYVAFDDFSVDGPLVVPGMKAYNPTPADKATDVPRDTGLSWTAPEGLVAYDVYFGTSADDVGAASRANPMGVLVSQGQSDMTYAPADSLEYGQIYCWRVDAIEADGVTMHAGDVWSFTAEPYVYAIENIVATSNAASEEATGPANTVNGSGLNASDQHSTEPTDMWLGIPGEDPVWIQFEFDKSYKLYEMWVWNYNVMFEKMLGLGLKDVTVEYSANGMDWTALGDVQLAQATARSTYTHNSTINLDGLVARFVRLTVRSGYGTMGQYGLSEVRFFYKPVKARDPQPANNKTGVSPQTALRWRAGREAATQEVYFDTSKVAVMTGTAPTATVTQSRYEPGELNLGTTYYWKIDEVNDAASPSRWDGDLWNFSTLEFLVVDDFESYTDNIDAREAIFDTWLDGWVNQTGSTVGYLTAPFAEKTIVHTGRQSMPLAYDNTSPPWQSEAERTWDSPQDWTRNGADTLRLFFRGYSLGFVETGAGSITMSGIGTDIWNTQDEFRFVYKPLTGDGSVIARVDSIENTDVWAKAGVMIRESLDSTSKYAMVMVTAASGVSFQQRISPGGASTSVTQATLEAPYWVKLTRAGNTFTAQRSADGVTWVAITADTAASSATISMIGDVYVGLAVTSHNAAAAATAQFSNVAITGSVSGPWQSAEIGVAQPSNTPDKLYVAVSDSSGRTGVAIHPDPAATLIDTWQQWQIPLSEFSAAGVALSRVKTLVIGVGDPDGQAAGGQGMVFIDDIGVGHPLAAEPMSTAIETFDVSRDFLTEGTEGTFWDGFLGLGDNETVDALNVSIDRAGQLFIQSTGAFFHEPWSPIGPFLYKMVEGNFIATVKVTDYAGTAEAPVYHNTCGLMARARPDDAGPGEDWVSLDYFPIWSCGNFVRSANDNVRTENGHNGKAFAADRYLQIERIGNVFHFRTSPDGVSWKPMAVSPLTRDDLDGVALQVGLFQATYSSDPGYAAFDDFILETPK